MLKPAHEHVMSGHLGVTKTFYRISKYFYWPICQERDRNPTAGGKQKCIYTAKTKTQSQKSASWHSPLESSPLPQRAEQRPASAKPAGQRGSEKAIDSRR